MSHQKVFRSNCSSGGKGTRARIRYVSCDFQLVERGHELEDNAIFTLLIHYQQNINMMFAVSVSTIIKRKLIAILIK